MYKFETNRPGEFRPIEAELDRLEILRTVAQPYPGSRPESLFGMIENQRMPIDDMLNIIEGEGEVVYLDIDTNISMSNFEKDVLKVSKNFLNNKNYIIAELTERVCAAELLMDDQDRSLGIRLPSLSDIEQLAHRVSSMIVSLPEAEDPGYKRALAAIFGGSIQITARIQGDNSISTGLRYPVYNKGLRKGVDIALPPHLTEILEKTEDLLPYIQDTSASELNSYFPSPEWSIGFIEGSGAKYISLMDRSSNIVLRIDATNVFLIVLLRVWAGSSQVPFRVSLCSHDDELAGFDVYQTESFLLKALISPMNTKPVLSLRTEPIASSETQSGKILPVNIGAARIIAIRNPT